MIPLSEKAKIADGPVQMKATPAKARIPPPTIAPIPVPVAPNKPIVLSVDSGDVSGLDLSEQIIITSRRPDHQNCSLGQYSLIDTSITGENMIVHEPKMEQTPQNNEYMKNLMKTKNFRPWIRFLAGINHATECIK